ncbi:MAG: acyl-CoA dehydrogenase [Candidatus Melainabacteria bacterium HGW-Melainabacteria-1]|nr:MAG: acyl-CoA dehydrogenase [Candidatus Melainabacteria bacterium HGW-Melainabacteria-1]
MTSPLTVLSEDEQLFKQMVNDFARKSLKPHVAEMDRDAKFKPELISQFHQLDLMGIEIPEAYDGAEASFFMSILAVEALSEVDPSAGVLVDVQNTLVINAIKRWATEDQKQRYFPKLAKEWVGAYALSEAGSGSDAFALATVAKEEGDHYLLQGRKLWITNAGEANLFIVFATTDKSLGYKGISAFLVERDFEGFSVGKKEDKLGIRASSTCELILDQCRVPKANVLGEIGKGYKVAIETLNEGRIGIGAQMVGLAQGALDGAISYAKERQQFGKSISQFQAVQFQLAEMAVEIEAARLMTYNCARLKDAGLPFLKEAAMCKYFASQVAEKVASLALEIYGGNGYTKEYPAEKFFRDCKIGKIYEGTSNMQLQTIAKLILG